MSNEIHKPSKKTMQAVKDALRKLKQNNVRDNDNTKTK